MRPGAAVVVAVPEGGNHLFVCSACTLRPLAGMQGCSPADVTSNPVWPGPLKGDPYKVLVVDDDPVCLRLVEQMLKHCNYAGILCVLRFVVFDPCCDPCRAGIGLLQCVPTAKLICLSVAGPNFLPILRVAVSRHSDNMQQRQRCFDKAPKLRAAV